MARLLALGILGLQGAFAQKEEGGECGQFQGIYYFREGGEVYSVNVTQDGCHLHLYHPAAQRDYSGMAVGMQKMRFSAEDDPDEMHEGSLQESGLVLWDGEDDIAHAWHRECVPLSGVGYLLDGNRSAFMVQSKETACSYWLEDGGERALDVSLIVDHWEVEWINPEKDFTLVKMGNISMDLSHIDWNDGSSWFAPRVTPCMTESLFEPHATFDHDCQGDEDVENATECVEMGCKWDGNSEDDDRCHCDKKICEQKFRLVPMTCSQVASWADPFRDMSGLDLHGKLASGMMPEICEDRDMAWMVMSSGARCCRDKVSFCGAMPPPKCSAQISREQMASLKKNGIMLTHCDSSPRAHEKDPQETPRDPDEMKDPSSRSPEHQ